MRRIWRLGLIGAAAGALVSQAVALVCYAMMGGSSGPVLPLPPGERRLPSFLRAWPEPDSGTIEGGLLSGHERATVRCPAPAPPDFRDDPPKYALYTDSFGWPAKSLVMYHAGVFVRGANGG